MTTLRANVVNNFKERMQLRRALIELEAQNVQNAVDMRRCQLSLVHHSQRQSNPDSTDSGSDAPIEWPKAGSRGAHRLLSSHNTQ